MNIERCRNSCSAIRPCLYLFNKPRRGQLHPHLPIPGRQCEDCVICRHIFLQAFQEMFMRSTVIRLKNEYAFHLFSFQFLSEDLFKRYDFDKAITAISWKLSPGKDQRTFRKITTKRQPIFIIQAGSQRCTPSATKEQKSLLIFANNLKPGIFRIFFNHFFKCPCGAQPAILAFKTNAFAASTTTSTTSSD